MDRFVSKSEPHAIDEYVESHLVSTQKTILDERATATSFEAKDILSICERLADTTTAEENKKGDEDDDEEENAAPPR